MGKCCNAEYDMGCRRSSLPGLHMPGRINLFVILSSEHCTPVLRQLELMLIFIGLKNLYWYSFFHLGLSSITKNKILYKSFV